MMKRTFSLVTLVVLLAFLLPGCGQNPVILSLPDVPAVGESTTVNSGEVRDLQPPERDPFRVESVIGAAGSTPGAPAPATSRDPFRVAMGPTPGGVIGAPAPETGRDPFERAANVVDLPPDPDDEIPPDDDPEPPDDPVVVTPGKVTLQIQTTDICWLDIYADNVRILRTNVQAGETLTFEAEAEVRLEQVGREWALMLVVNGQNLGKLSSIVTELQKGPLTLPEAGVRISLQQRYTGGVLVGLRFTAITAN
jgi:hypothetical protein